MDLRGVLKGDLKGWVRGFVVDFDCDDDDDNEEVLELNEEAEVPRRRRLGRGVEDIFLSLCPCPCTSLALPSFPLPVCAWKEGKGFRLLVGGCTDVIDRTIINQPYRGVSYLIRSVKNRLRKRRHGGASVTRCEKYYLNWWLVRLFM